MSVIWKINIISKLVGISEAIRLILILFKLNLFNLIKTFILNKNIILFILYKMLNRIYNTTYYMRSIVPISVVLYRICLYIVNSHICVSNYSTTSKNNLENNNNEGFKQWLAGLIDGDGYFILTKKGYASCEITMDARDKKALYEIKQKYGGSIKLVSNANALRYKLRHKKGLISLINDVNGHLRNPARLLQINKLCVKYNIELKYPEPLTFNNGWLSGFIDSDGSIYFNEASGQVFIGISQKNKYLLEPLIRLYGGRVDILSPKI